MLYKNILLTGGSGKLGGAILATEHSLKIFAPTKEVMDITNQQSINKFIESNDVNGVIHCAALVNILECEKNPLLAIDVNICGTTNLVKTILEKEKRTNKKIRFIYISTDAVYAGTNGGYSEESIANPHNIYGLTKFGGESSVRALFNHCIIRTSFFNPNSIDFGSSPVDVFNSKIPLDQLVEAIILLLNSDFIGIINIGTERKSNYERYKQYKPELKSCTREEMISDLLYVPPIDTSMDIGLWESIKKDF